VSRTVVQVTLRWHMQLGNIVIPKSTNRDRMAENLAIFDFELNLQQMTRVSGVIGTRLGPDPDQFD
jgi:2,5-diketo-D-gluconate reductase A